MVKGWMRNPKEGRDNRPIETREKVEYAWRERNADPGDYLSVVRDMSNSGYYINFSVSGSQNQTRLASGYTNKERARKHAVKAARMRNKGATVDELKRSISP
jgi:hypothetical protein